MRRLLTIIALFAALSCKSNANPPYNPIASSIDSADGRHFCTAWPLNEQRGLWVTAAHCVASQDSPMPIPFIRSALATPIWVDSLLDLAVIEGTHVKGLELAFNAPAVGDSVTIVGHPFGFEQIEGKARIVLLHQQVDGEGVRTIFAGVGVGPGSSGGPVLHRGKVVSVLQLGWSVGGFFAGTPWEVMLRALRPFIP